MNRRIFIAGTAASVSASGAASSAFARPRSASGIRAVAFDAFAIFDPRPIAALAERYFPGQGRALVEAWRTRQFEYQWLRVVSGHYQDFWRTTEDALLFAAELLRLTLTDGTRRGLMGAYLELTAWPDVAAALASLKSQGLRLALLSNATPAILRAGIANAGLDDVFEHVLSTDALQTYKPHPRAYRLALRAFRLNVDELVFVPFAGWDAAGAKAFGYRTFWVNRMGLPAERIDLAADAMGRDLTDLAVFLRATRDVERTRRSA